MIERRLFGFDRSAHMKELHRLGRYTGTSKIGAWNSSEDKRIRMAELRSRNSLDKSSRGYGSEYHMRVSNRLLLHNKFQGRQGYLYFLEFPSSIKVGFSKDYMGRVSYLGGSIIRIVSGPTNDLADLEFDIFMKFMNFTKLNDEGTRYTEFMDKSIKDKVLKFIIERVNNIKELSFIK
jgi:hypothetical protein